MLWRVTLIVLILAQALAIKFTYSLPPSSSYCFYEIVERNSRFQLIVRSTSPEVSVSLFTPTASIQTLADPDTFEKSYAGFSDDNEQVHFCLSNPLKATTKSMIQFYHGLNLQNVEEVVSLGDFKILKEANDNLHQITKLLQQGFVWYNQRMTARVLKHQGVSWTYNVMTILIVGLVVGLGFTHVFRFKNFLHTKKYI